MKLASCEDSGLCDMKRKNFLLLFEDIKSVSHFKDTKKLSPPLSELFSRISISLLLRFLQCEWEEEPNRNMIFQVLKTIIASHLSSSPHCQPLFCNYFPPCFSPVFRRERNLTPFLSLKET